ncbi:GlsB/YeaQ/YmgE family stress response membrane protein [Labrys neptuniae]
MGDLGWIWTIIVGIIAGFAASKVVNKSGSGLIMDLVIGLVGAFVGNFVGRTFLSMGAASGILQNVLVSFAGAVVVLLIYNAVMRRR